MTEHPGADAATAATPGARLAAAREAHGLTVTQVAEQMRISPRQVQAIEADRYDELPGAVFVRGFVRNYARLVKLDPAPLLQALEPQLGAEVPLRAHEIAGTLPETTRRGHHRSRLGVIVVLVLLLVAIAFAYHWWRGRSLQAPIVPGTGVVRPAPAPTTPGVPTEKPVPLAPERLSDEAPSAQQDMDASAAGEAPAAAVPPAETTTPATTPPATPAGSAARLEVEAMEASWIEVRDGDGQVLFSDTVPGGGTRAIEGKAPLEVVVGNASGVRITYNGKPFDVSAHAARNIARFRLE